MVILLLIIIYLAFISLGLPDGLLGVAWPSMRGDFGESLDAAGLVSIFIVGSTIISSFMSGYMIKRVGTGKITFISCLMTGSALLGFSLAPSYIWLLVLAVPLGLGGGTVDTSLNNYVAVHYKSHHMNWLHSFWGVGATLGPIIMGQALASSISWRGGYRIVSIIQLSLAVVLFISLPLWKMNKKAADISDITEETSDSDKLIDRSVFRINGVKYALLTFFFYCAVELSMGLWGSAYLINVKNITADTAAYWIAVYYGSITAGRFISGFISLKISNNRLIQLGVLISLAGAALLLVPVVNDTIIPILLIGLGLSPIFPAMIHETPARFGKDKSQTIIGYQMGFAYIGSTIMPPILGVMLNNINMILFPIFIIAGVTAMLIITQRLKHIKCIQN